jgi:hypothetical protein
MVRVSNHAVIVFNKWAAWMAFPPRIIQKYLSDLGNKRRCKSSLSSSPSTDRHQTKRQPFCQKTRALPFLWKLPLRSLSWKLWTLCSLLEPRLRSCANSFHGPKAAISWSRRVSFFRPCSVHGQDRNYWWHNLLSCNVIWDDACFLWSVIKLNICLPTFLAHYQVMFVMKYVDAIMRHCVSRYMYDKSVDT